jgi:hypothetical protein
MTMHEYTLELKLLSDTIFNMGAGVSGVVDAEIQQDEIGLPILSGRAIKGLLVNECSEILYALGSGNSWEQVAKKLFGQHGETLDDKCGLHISSATLAPDLVAAIHHQFIKISGEPSRQDLLEALTSIRHQTAINILGAPEDETLRASRLIVRGLTLYGSLHFDEPPEDDEKALLAACVLSLRRAGLGRTRGKGKIQAKVTDCPIDPEEFSKTEHSKDLTKDWFDIFKEKVAS